jgi:hypothetical protein
MASSVPVLKYTELFLEVCDPNPNKEVSIEWFLTFNNLLHP